MVVLDFPHCPLKKKKQKHHLKIFWVCRRWDNMAWWCTGDLISWPHLSRRHCSLYAKLSDRLSIWVFFTWNNMIKLQDQIECRTSVWKLPCLGWNCFTVGALFDDRYSFCNIHQLRFNSRHYPPGCRSTFSFLFTFFCCERPGEWSRLLSYVWHVLNGSRVQLDHAIGVVDVFVLPTKA